MTSRRAACRRAGRLVADDSYDADLQAAGQARPDAVQVTLVVGDRRRRGRRLLLVQELSAKKHGDLKVSGKNASAPRSRPGSSPPSIGDGFTGRRGRGAVLEDHHAYALSSPRSRSASGPALGACSPYDPDLGSTPFLCGTVDPACPDGYACQDDGTGKMVCVTTSGDDRRRRAERLPVRRRLRPRDAEQERHDPDRVPDAGRDVQAEHHVRRPRDLPRGRQGHLQGRHHGREPEPRGRSPRGTAGCRSRCRSSTAAARRSTTGRRTPELAAAPTRPTCRSAPTTPRRTRRRLRRTTTSIAITVTQ